jgi:hypothetical protein
MLNTEIQAEERLALLLARLQRSDRRSDVGRLVGSRESSGREPGGERGDASPVSGRQFTNSPASMHSGTACSRNTRSCPGRTAANIALCSRLSLPSTSPRGRPKSTSSKNWPVLSGASSGVRVAFRQRCLGIQLADRQAVRTGGLESRASSSANWAWKGELVYSRLEQHPFVRSAGPFLRPDLPSDRAARAAAVKTGRRPPPEAARSGLDGGEQVLG